MELSTPVSLQTTNKRKILLILSTDIDIQQLRESPRLLGYHLYSVGILDSFYDNWQQIVLYPNLSEAIKKVAPEVVLTHFGSAFQKYTLEILHTFVLLKNDFSGIKFGFDRDFKAISLYLHSLREQSQNPIILDFLSVFSMSDLDDEIVFLRDTIF